MKRIASAFALASLAPAAAAWVPCNAPGVTPPVTVLREAPAYPAAMRELDAEGAVELSLTVLLDGTVGWVRVLRAEPRGYFEQAAVAGVRAWRFEPARAGGRAIECRMLTRVRFALVDTVDEPVDEDAERPAPAYPPTLLAGRVEGYVEVEFEVTTTGAVRQARVINAMPRGEFEGAALAAIRRWRFDDPPQVLTERRTRHFEFRLPYSTLAEVPPTVFAAAPFPMQACEKRITGRVTLEVDTDATGAVQKARILSAQPGSLFNAAALAIARGSRLSPAYRAGRPAAATALLTLIFDPALATCPGTLGPERDRP
ncbi:MAG: energy transducer TonB [Gammaproteobacteria bacterium]